MISTRLVQLENAPYGISVRFFESLILSKRLPSNAYSSIVVTLSGKVTSPNIVPVNAFFPIFVNPSGSVIFCKELQP